MTFARPQWWRGLLARVTIGYALGTLVLTSAGAFATFELAKNALLGETRASHSAQAFANAINLRRDLENLENIDDLEQEITDEVDAETDVLGPFFDGILADLNHANDSKSLLVLPDATPDGTPRERTLNLLTLDDIPTTVQAQLLDGPQTELQQVYYQNGVANYVIGMRLPNDITYYEVLELENLQSTLGQLRVILFGVTVVASLAGAALGYYAARRALLPLPRISNAARSIAEGDFETRLDLQVDPDLEVLTGAFNDMADAVGERITREQRFTSNVSHELRSPLMTLTASVEVLERRKESLPDVAQQAIELLSQDLDRFKRLVEDLLEISRMEAGAVQLQLSRFGLAEFLENVIFLSNSPHLQLDAPPSDAKMAITADKRRLAQVMSNLIENADKYGDGATGVSFEVVGDMVQIVVDDAGPGVEPEDRERIFERFGRMDTTAGNRSNTTGFGLGLALVREHVRLHGGRVRVTDRIDGERGARFVVELPVGEHIDVLDEMAE